MLRVWVNIRPTLTEIGRSVFECREHTSSVQDLGAANVCLHVHESRRNQLGESSLAQDNLESSSSGLPSHGLPFAHLGNSWFSQPSYPLLSPLDNLESFVTFDLTLDPGRLNPRAIFKETNTRHLSRVRVLGLGQHCEDVKLLLPVRGLGVRGWRRL